MHGLRKNSSDAFTTELGGSACLWHNNKCLCFSFSLFICQKKKIHIGYYTAARRYEFYFRVVKTIFYERAQRVSKILFLTRENKIHIFKPPCNFLFII